MPWDLSGGVKESSRDCPTGERTVYQQHLASSTAGLRRASFCQWSACTHARNTPNFVLPKNGFRTLTNLFSLTASCQSPWQAILAPNNETAGVADVVLLATTDASMMLHD
eukprot:2915694-Amphidinium_carterae.1